MSELMKVGDKIAVPGRYSGWELATIKKVTPTMYVCERWRFRHDMTIVAPGKFGPSKGRIPTPEIFLEIRLQNARARMAYFKVTNENLEAVETLLNGESS